MYMVLMELIKTNEELVDVCKSISEEKFITIDTEFIREKTYWPIGFLSYKFCIDGDKFFFTY